MILRTCLYVEYNLKCYMDYKLQPLSFLFFTTATFCVRAETTGVGMIGLDIGISRSHKPAGGPSIIVHRQERWVPKR